ncbi:hypothetical protein KP13_04050 [Klebsiella pneumoniae subsp. pneumoniae Kp13]|nr:hypothetical protein KP13_04050 [Klebsiella pneumoniae subsp. pneumoniae Kp13]
MPHVYSVINQISTSIKTIIPDIKIRTTRPNHKKSIHDIKSHKKRSTRKRGKTPCHTKTKRN